MKKLSNTEALKKNVPYKKRCAHKKAIIRKCTASNNNCYFLNTQITID